MQRNSERSAIKMSAEENVNHRTMQVIINVDLGFHSYCKRKVQGLTVAQIIKGL